MKQTDGVINLIILYTISLILSRKSYYIAWLYSINFYKVNKLYHFLYCSQINMYKLLTTIEIINILFAKLCLL